MMEYKYLFTPIKVGSTTIKNRIFSAPHGTSFSKDNILDERYIEYQRMRAKGGVGMIVAGGMTILPNTKDFLCVQEIYDEKVVPMLRRLGEAVHPYGAKVFVQLAHCGRQMESGFSRQPIWAPSAIPCPVVRETPKEMEVEDIKDAVNPTSALCWSILAKVWSFVSKSPLISSGVFLIRQNSD
jgi:2,4-dienoyl-CoA reductase-like NADH-dependent reductase (Old Yellow Enzyme family)